MHILSKKAQCISCLRKCSCLYDRVPYFSFVGVRLTRYGLEIKLDRGSIRSSPRYGLSTPRRTVLDCSIHHVLFNMGDLHLVLPSLNLSTLNAGILIMMQYVRSDDVLTEHGGLLHVLPLAVHLRFFCWKGRGTSLNLGWGGWPMRF